MDESWKMPWMNIQSDHVAVQRFSWWMPWMSNQSDHVAVQGFSSMMPWMIILSKVTMLRYKDFHG